MSSANPITLVEYRLVIGFPLYRVGNDGSVWSRIVNCGPATRVGDRWHRLKGHVNKKGYRVVTLYSHLGSKVYTRKVARLVLEAFVGPKPPGMEPCHDPDPAPTNNNLSNLRWDTPKGNAGDAVRHGRIVRGSATHAAKLTEDDIPVIRDLKSSGHSYREIGRRYGVAVKTVTEVVKRKSWKHVP